ncbi:MAG: T9SS type B sorting domain-containing protein [Flavobacteriales bacterium]|nr:T9SS type B sorting domain-containing protein [Flavobacteriales bacterium]
MSRLSSIFLTLISCLTVQLGVAQFTIGGSASNLGGGCFRLTSAVNSQAGYVYKTAGLNLNEAFDYRFSVYLGTSNAGADGIMFVLRGALGTPYIGTGGGGLGFNGTGFSTNALGVEVDTWYNGNYGDIAADHIGIETATPNHNLAGPIQASTSSANVEDGNWHTLNIRWDPIQKELDVYLDCDYRLQYAGDLIDSVFNGDTIVHWGFLGTTGGANNLQQFCFTVPIDSFVTSLIGGTICAGDSIQLQAGDSAVSYNWTPTGSLSTNGIPNPWASPVTSTMYYVEQTYQCDTLTDSALITVLNPDFTVSGAVSDALCNGDCNGEIDLTVQLGSGQFLFEWSNGDTIPDITGLCVGNYTVTVQDVDTGSAYYLCRVIEQFTVGEPSILTSTVVNPSKTSCPDGLTCDANATAVANGGTVSYSYLWTSGETGNPASNLCADTNWVTITDANGCTSESFVLIDVPDSIRTTGFGDTLICITNPAVIIAGSQGGTPPFYYVWRKNALNGPTVASTSAVTVYPDLTTTYYVSSTDSNGCAGDTSKVVVKVRPPLGVTLPELDTICPYDSIDILVEGTGGDSIYTYTWSSGEFGSAINVGPDEPSWFVVTVSDACGTPTHLDSVYVQVGGYSPIATQIRVEDDTLCAGDRTHIIASGRGGYHGPEEYVFNWAHVSDKNPIQFVSPNKTTEYVVTISDLCLSEPGTARITVYVGKPEVPEMLFEPSVACAETDVTISIPPLKTGHVYNWDLGDGNTLMGYEIDSVIHRYSTSGCYDVTLATITDFGCLGQRKNKCAIQILDQPTADFGTDPTNPSNVNSILLIRDESIGAETLTWYIEEDTIIDVELFSREFNEYPGSEDVKLVVVSPEGCVDSITRTLVWQNETLIYYPSAFSPDQDGINDEFRIIGEAISDENFDLTIFNRWGQQVFRTVRRQRGWDGRSVDGTWATLGSYPFVLRYMDHIGEVRTIRGDVIITQSGNKTPLR